MLNVAELHAHRSAAAQSRQRHADRALALRPDVEKLAADLADLVDKHASTGGQAFRRASEHAASAWRSLEYAAQALTESNLT